MKFLIIGLGNPGAEYINTRHNAGFMVLDRLANRSGAFFHTARLGELAELRFRGREVRLLKPSTYMNLSGKAVQYWMQKEKIPLEQILVVVDDLALPFGSIRLRAKGSDAGHNGLRDIQNHLQTTAYPRLRIGIGKNFLRGHQVEYVLAHFSEEEQQTLDFLLENAANAIETFLSQGCERAMNIVNTTSSNHEHNASR